MMKSKARTRYLTVEEEGRLLAALPVGVKRDVCAFLFDTGARVNEALSLTWDDLRHHERMDRVTFFRTKSGRARTVPLTLRAQECLQRAKLEGRCRPFPVRYHAFYVAFCKARDAAGLGKDVVVHTVRHTFASRLVQRGMGVPKVSLALGHSSIVLTMRYSHLDPHALDGMTALLQEQAS